MRGFPFATSRGLYLCAVLALASAACGELAGPGPLHDPAIDIIPASMTLEVGVAMTIEVEATDSSGARPPAEALVWTSADDDVAVVDSTGTVWGRGVGSALVLVRLGGPAGPRDSVRIDVVAPGAVAGAQVVTGRDHSCALDAEGLAWCWGDDARGQLGNGGVPGEPSKWARPVAVAGGHRFEALSAGPYHTCGLASDGRVLCWGRNDAGQLGTGGTENSPEAVAVAGGISFSHVSAGGEHTCGLDGEGRAYCWGRGVRGQLGTGAADDAMTPQPVATDLRFESLAGGGWHSCGLDDAGAAWCWGQWRYYSSDYIPESLVPVRIMEGSTFWQLDAALLSTCGVRSDASIECLGHFSNHMPFVPDDLPAMAAVAAGSGFVCGVSLEGQGYCWGANDKGQLGDGTTTGTTSYDESGTRHDRAALVLGGHGFTQLAPGWGEYGGRNGHSCGLTDAGNVFCWGMGGNGEIGGGMLDFATTPVPIETAPGLVTVSASRDHACGLTAHGEAWCWGSGRYGQLGTGDFRLYSERPVPVQGGLRFTDIAAANSFTCGVATDGAAYCWGLNDEGHLADGTRTNRSVPSPVTGGLRFEEIEGGGLFVCARAGTDAYCWGSYWPDPFPDPPTRIPATVEFASVAAGCGLTPAGAAYCWDGASPATAVPGGLAFTALDVGGRHTCAIDTSGRAHCWGVGTGGALGTGSYPERLGEPAEVAGAYTFERVSAGYYHTCGVTTDGRVLCWGVNDDGQLGDGSRYVRPAPVEVTPSGAVVRDVSAGEIHTCVAEADGGLWCWGGRGRGGHGWALLGDGVQWRTRPSPVGTPLSP